MNVIQHVEKKTVKRGAARRKDCIFIGAWVPSTLAVVVDILIQEEDSDRSKYLRQALKEKIKRDKDSETTPTKEVKR